MINKNDLISIIVKPTNACNLRCKHCYHAEQVMIMNKCQTKY